MGNSDSISDSDSSSSSQRSMTLSETNDTGTAPPIKSIMSCVYGVGSTLDMTNDKGKQYEDNDDKKYDDDDKSSQMIISAPSPIKEMNSAETDTTTARSSMISYKTYNHSDIHGTMTLDPMKNDIDFSVSHFSGSTRL